MIRFVASRAASCSGLGAAEILGARQFVAAVIDNIVLRKSRHYERSHLRDLHLDRDRRENQKGFQHIGRHHDSQREESEGSLSSQTPLRARHGGPDGAHKLAPARRPLHQQLGCVVKFDSLFELESFTHERGT
jgi:hypothetical protein